MTARPLLRLPAIAVACLLTLLAARTEAEEVRVADKAALDTALAEAGPGTEILLAPGDYGGLSVRNTGGSATAPIVIRSRDAADPARFSRMAVQNAENVVIADLELDYVFAKGDPHHLKPFKVNNSRGITLRSLLIDGDVVRGGTGPANGYGHTTGFSARGVEGLTVEDTEIRTFLRGMLIHECRDILVRGNNLHGMQADAMDFVQVSNVRIEGNFIHDFARSPESKHHPDMIQFWTAGTNRPSRDVVIRGNLLAAGNGPWSQTIFARNEVVDRGGPEEMWYRNFTITDNLIINAHLHGISFGEIDGLVVARNTLVAHPGAAGDNGNKSVWIPRINIKKIARNVRIENNVAGGIKDYQKQPDWRVANNLVVQNQTRMKPNFYGLVFAGTDPLDPNSFRPKPGGPLDGTGIGVTFGPRRP
ncbi:MAG: right-handed parallel beta-helix repeat-containing protein [Pseudooceanicola nanhaiensis]